MFAHKESAKAVRYLESLEDARCEGRWNDVPELARKVAKHAPTRKCLVLTARTEARIALQSARSPATPRSTSDDFAEDAKSLSSLLEAERLKEEEDFQARTCLGWLYWTTGAYDKALSSLPPHASPAADSATEAKGLSQTTYVSVVRGAYIRGGSQAALGQNDLAVETYQNAAAGLSSLPVTIGSEYRLWAERLLTRVCRLQEADISKMLANDEGATSVLAPFRAYAKLWQGQAGPGHAASRMSTADDRVNRRLVWHEYYSLLSTLLANEGSSIPGRDRELSSGPTFSSDHSALRGQLSAELRLVEGAYEVLLMEDLRFPEASQVNIEIDEWVDQVMLNWSIMCGSTWSDQDLGDGGQVSLTRSVMDILYRAATRSFHSLPILRHLFTTHASLAEFELAGKALDSYIEIATKAKARIEKSSEAEPGVDSLETMIRTVSFGIDMLCRFGRRSEGLKAQDLAALLIKWLQEHETHSMNRSSSGTLHPVGADLKATDRNDPIGSAVLTAAHRAIGVSHANWARLTYEPATRSACQATAIEHLRLALRPVRALEEDPETLYALALVLAETRDIEGAVATTKAALSTKSRSQLDSHNGFSLGTQRGPSGTSRPSLVKCWHILSLLLSSRQDFETAEATCQAAVELSEDQVRVIESGTASTLIESDILTKQQMLELRMTQMLLAEVCDGPDVAVNGASQLLSLYARLFNRVEHTASGLIKLAQTPPTANDPRSGKESALGYRGTRPSIPHSAYGGTPSVARLSDETSRPLTMALAEEDHLRPPPTSHSTTKRLQKHPSKRSLHRVQGGGSTKIPNVKTSSNLTAVTAENVNSSSMTAGVQHVSPGLAGAHDAQEIGQAVSDSLAVTSQADGEYTYEGTTSSLQRVFRCPPPRFSDLDYQRYALSLLLKIWLLIASLYRRAKMFDDAHEAVGEAFKHVQSIEANVALIDSSAHSFDEPYWAGMKSVEELWADAYAEKGYLCLAESKPHEAMNQFESALSHFPDHLPATVGLSNILLDIYARAIPTMSEDALSRQKQPAPFSPDITPTPSPPTLISIPLPPYRKENTKSLMSVDRPNPLPSADQPSPSGSAPSDLHDCSPETLDRLAARDRAYALLSSLTKFGAGWDSSEAWFALARAYEESGQIEKAQEVLWWVVELEEKRPIRHWNCLGQGYAL